MRPQWPAWYFGPNGEERIFQKIEDVPKGWQDHPSKFKPRAPEGETEDAEGEPLELTREQIVADLERRGVSFKPTATDKALLRLLEKTIEEQG